MKKLISLFVVLMCMTAVKAQSPLIATLNHGDKVSVYYGYGALVEANEAASHGDVITLSAGTFKSPTIEKNITLRGAGAEVDTEMTRLDGDIYIVGAPDSIDGHLTMEGIFCNDQLFYGARSKGYIVKNAHFIKCVFEKVTPQYTESKLDNANFVQCKITSYIYLNSINTTANFQNCYIDSPGLSSNSSCYYTFNNCIIKYNSAYQPLCNSLFTNCILYHGSTNPYKLSSSCQAYNCLGISNANNNIFSNLYPINKYETISSSNISSIFKTYTGTYKETETFELTDSAKTKYLGMDGREVGIYGGVFPFTLESSLPKITKFNVASKSTEEGKLRVEIEVSGIE